MISRFSVKKPYTVLVGVVLAIILGIVSFTRMTADLLPNISLPYVIVMTTYPGANPETVESVVTQPVEAAMATVSNIESISSVSNESYSMVILEFAQTADMNAVSLEIRENLDQIKSYWDDSVGNPIIMKLNPDMLPVMIAAVGVEGMDNAQISTYVQESVMPELESLEGVASVSATGLLEESVNVIIRQDKVDAVNGKVYAAIDEKMREAEEELADGRKELEDGKKELADGKKELLDGRKELADGKKELEDGRKELEDGRQELENQQEAINNQLAVQKNSLLSAKAQLEEIQTNLATAKQLNDGIGQMASAVEQFGVIEKEKGSLEVLRDGEYLTRYTTYMTEWADALGRAMALLEAGGSFATPEGVAIIGDFGRACDNIDKLQAEFRGNTALPLISGVSEQLAGILAAEEALPRWYPVIDFSSGIPDQSVIPDEEAITQLTTVVGTALGAAKEAAGSMLELLEQNGGILVKYEDMKSALAALTSGLGYDGYVAMVNEMLQKQNITDLAQAINDINSGLIAIEKGQMAAAIEFANGKATISMGEYQLEVAESQLKTGEEQIKSGLEQMEDAEEQLKDAEKQLEEGEKQLADAKAEAYEQADMTKILTVDTIKNLLTAQNFSMPAGYVTEEGISYMVRVGDKPSTVEELQALPLMDLHMDGVPVITLGDVADVFYTDNSAEIYTNVDGSAGVMLSIQKQTGYSTGEVSDSLGERFGELMEENPDLSLIKLMDQGIYIDLVMDSILNNILVGGVLAILILLVFLKDLRPTLVVAFSIPVSLVTAIVCMYFSGVTLNIISLSGLALGIGMLVDNSIVVIENIYRL